MWGSLVMCYQSSEFEMQSFPFFLPHIFFMFHTILDFHNTNLQSDEDNDSRV